MPVLTSLHLLGTFWKNQTCIIIAPSPLKTIKIFILSHLVVKYCKTFIIRVTLFSWGHHPECIHEIIISRFVVLLFYNSYIRNYWRWLYFLVTGLSRIYTKIKSSRIKSVLQYLDHKVTWVFTISSPFVIHSSPYYLCMLISCLVRDDWWGTY